jgi:cytochrome c-type biogenesis protein CcmH/NrfG
MKSRDEIMSFLFIILTFIYTFKALESKKVVHFVVAGVMYFLSLLSKEYAFTLIFVIPMMIYVFRPELITFKQLKLYSLFLILIAFSVLMYVSKMSVEVGDKTNVAISKILHTIIQKKFLLPFVLYPFVVVSSAVVIFLFRRAELEENPEEKNNIIPTLVIFLATAVVCLLIHKVKKVDLYLLLPLVFVPAVLGIILRDIRSRSFNFLYGSMVIAFVFYLALRFYSVTLKPGVPDTEVLNNPYLFATKSETYATKTFVLLKYMKLLFVPYPLSSDYSFKTILYRTFASWDTLLSIFVYLGLAVTAVILFIKRHPVGFGLVFFFANLMMIGNIVFDIGATMGERLIYHSSFGFALCIAWLLTEGLKKINIQPQVQKVVVLGLALALTAVFGYITINRNAEWKSDITLFTTDVKTVPNSVLCLGNAGARWIDLSERPENKDSSAAYLERATGYLKHALQLHPKYVNGYLNLGLAQMKQGKLDDAFATWKKAQGYYPNNPYLQTYFPYLAINYMNKGVNLGKEGKVDEATKNLDKAVECNPNNYDIWYNYAGVYFTKGDFQKAKTGFENCLKLNPNGENAKQGLQAAMQQLGMQKTAVVK